MTNGERTKLVLVKLREIQTQLSQEIFRIEQECEHEIVEVGADPRHGWHGSAVCEWCSADFGWWCPDSPDHTCHYYTYEVDGLLGTTLVQGLRAVKLVDGAEHIINDYQGDPEYETNDDCVFCHDPDERK